MTVKTEALTGLFDQAVGTFGDAMRAGVKIQEEIASFWTGAIDQTGQAQQVQDWNHRSRAFLSEAIPAAQKNVEQWTKLLEQNCQRSVELLKVAFEPADGHSAQDVQ